MKTKKEISKLLGIDQNTLKNWESNRPELHKIVMEHFDESKKDLNNINYLQEEIIKTIKKLPEAKAKKFYYLMQIELIDMGH